MATDEEKRRAFLAAMSGQQAFQPAPAASPIPPAVPFSPSATPVAPAPSKLQDVSAIQDDPEYAARKRDMFFQSVGSGQIPSATVPAVESLPRPARTPLASPQQSLVPTSTPTSMPEVAIQGEAPRPPQPGAAFSGQIKGAKASLEGLQKKYIESLKAETEAGVKQNEAVAYGHAAAAEQNRLAATRFQRMADEEMRSREAQRFQEKDAMDRYLKASEQAAAQAQTVGPAGYWQQGGGVRIGASIIGGFFAGLGGRKAVEQFQNRIDQAVDRDVKAQIYRADSAKSAANSQFNAYQALRESGLDDAQARNAARNIGYKQVMAQLDEIMAKNKSEEVQARGPVMRAELERKLAEGEFAGGQATLAALIKAQQAAAAKPAADVTEEEVRHVGESAIKLKMTEKGESLDTLLGRVDSQIAAGKGDEKLPGLGIGSDILASNRITKRFLSQEDRDNRLLSRSVAQQVGQELSGASVPKEMVAEIKESIQNANDANEMRTALMAARSAKEKAEQTWTGMNRPEAVDVFKARIRGERPETKRGGGGKK